MYIYLIFDPFSRLTKIGRSKNPNKRFKTIKTYNPHAELFFYSKNFTESELHEKFKNKREAGEWFALDKKDLFYITKDYRCIPKRLHYSNTIKDNNRKKYNDRLNNLLDLNFIYELKDYSHFKYTDKDVLVNTKTGNIKRLVLNGRSKGYWINKKFYSLNTLRKQLQRIVNLDCPF